MRSSHLPFKISTLVILFILLFSSQSTFAQSGWQSTYSNNVFTLNKIIKRDSLNYFAFSNSSKYYLKSSDGGNNWISRREFILDSNYNHYILDGVFVNENTGWIVGFISTSNAVGIILKTSNGGNSWIKQNIGIGSYGYNNVNFINETTGWIGSWGGAAYPELLKTTNGGINWVGESIPPTSEVRKVKFTNSNFGWILYYGGYLCKTTNAGQNWISDTTFKYLYLYDVAPVSENECWVLARDGAPASRYYKTTNGGQNWNLIYTNKNLTGELKFFDAQTGYAYAGDNNNVILKTTNGGNNWDSTYVISARTVNSVLPINGIEILTTGSSTTSWPAPVNTFVNIVKSSNSGVNWNEIYNNRNYVFTGVYFKDNQNGLAIESGGLILRTTNGGTNWLKIYENSLYSFNIIKAFSDTSVFIFATNGKILRSNNLGDNWTLINAPGRDAKNAAQFVNVNTGYAIGNPKYMIKTTNGGFSWDSLPVPVTGTGFYEPYGYINSSYKSVKFINENTGWIIGNDYYYIYGGIHPGHGYDVTAIQKTTNGGLNWSAKYSYTVMDLGIRYSIIDFTNDTLGFMYGSNIIFKTTNSGSNWVPYANLSFSCFNLNMLNENTGWIGGTDNIGGAIFKTTNAGLNWFTQFHENGKSVNSIFIKDENNLWFCGGNNGIYKTTNGGGIISAINPISSNIPEGFLLKQNYPNPFNPTTKINFDLKNSAFTLLRVYDITGREVRTLVNEKFAAGSYSYDFNASELPSGVYFYQLQTEGFIETKKMILLK